MYVIFAELVLRLFPDDEDTGFDSIGQIQNKKLNYSSLFHAIVVVAPFIEELAYRYFLFNIVLCKGFKLSVFVSALISSLYFSFSHITNLSFGQSLSTTSIQMFATFIMGMRV